MLAVAAAEERGRRGGVSTLAELRRRRCGVGIVRGLLLLLRLRALSLGPRGKRMAMPSTVATVAAPAPIISTTTPSASSTAVIARGPIRSAMCEGRRRSTGSKASRSCERPVRTIVVVVIVQRTRVRGTV